MRCRAALADRLDRELEQLVELHTLAISADGLGADARVLGVVRPGTGTILPEDLATDWLGRVSYNADATLSHVPCPIPYGSDPLATASRDEQVAYLLNATRSANPIR